MKNKTVLLQRTGKADLEFEGDEIVSSTSNPRGTKKRWTELKVFSAGSRYVVQVLGLSEMDGERTRSTVDVVDELEDIPNVLGFGDLAKEIYRKLQLIFIEKL